MPQDVYKRQTEGAVILLVNVTEKLERENLRREFSANVSHELKTPLTSISGFAEIMHCLLYTSNSTSVMMTTVAGDENAIGYISLGSLDDTVKAVKIDGVEAVSYTHLDVYKRQCRNCKRNRRWCRRTESRRQSSSGTEYSMRIL